PSSTAMPRSKASAKPGLVSTSCSTMRAFCCTAALIRPPKWNGTSSPMSAPATGCSSTTSVSMPALAAVKAAANPAGPAPTTTSGTCRSAIGGFAAAEAGSMTGGRERVISRHARDLPPSAAEELRHRLAIPFDEGDDAVLALLRIGAGAVAERVDAALVALDEVAVLEVRLVPDLDEVLEIVVAPLLGLAIDEPVAGDERLLRPRGQHGEEEGVVAEHVVEGRGIVRPAHRADVAARNVPEQLLDRRLAVHRDRDGAFEQRQAHDAEIAAWSPLAVGIGQAQLGAAPPQRLDAGELGELRGAVLGDEAARQLGMASRAMEALARILHYQLPIA